MAGWAEMLRDTMAGAAGLEQAIIASAAVAPLPLRREVATLAAAWSATAWRRPCGPSPTRLPTRAPTWWWPPCCWPPSTRPARLGEVLGTLAASARDAATMRLRVEAARARTPHLGKGHRRGDLGARSAAGRARPRLPGPLREPASASSCWPWWAACSPPPSCGWPGSTRPATPGPAPGLSHARP